MTPLDWLIILFCVAMAVWGARHGLLVGALTVAGFAVGAFAGSRLGPELLAEGAESPYAPLVTLAGGVLLGSIAAIGMEGVARALQVRLIRGSASTAVDGAGGAILFAALGLALAWLVAAVALNTPGLTDVRTAVQRSEVLTRLNTAFPPTAVLRVLNRISPTPQVRGPDADVGAPAPAIARDPEVDAAAGSVVRVVGTACGLGVGGSGWVAEPDLVVTNAHVIAGQADTAVETAAGARLDATPVHYDPRNDLAVLRVDGIGASPLPLAEQPEKGAEAAVLGYPENRGYTVTPARIGTTAQVLSQDSYGRGPMRRQMTAFRARVRSGNSGGPVVDAQGRVQTTVFAAAVDGRPRSGLGIPNRIVRRGLRRADGPVDTGPCAR